MKKYIYNKKNNIYRSDICINTKDYRLANLVRALNYEKIPYKIINNELYYIKDENNIIHINFNEKDYEVLDKHYINIIPLWETEQKNAKKYEDLYNDKKWIIGKRELKRVHNKLLILDNGTEEGFKLKVGFLWKKQPFEHRPTYTKYKKFVKMFEARLDNNVIIENENWGAILAQTQQYIKDNAKQFYDSYDKISIYGYCKSENKWFEIVKFDILQTEWLVNNECLTSEFL